MRSEEDRSGAIGAIVPSHEPALEPSASPRRILIVGATGYVGSRLVPRLLARGHHLTLLVRHPRRIADRPWARSVSVVEGDLLDPASLAPAFRDVDVAVYLVHSLNAGRRFSQLDRDAAVNFTRAGASLSHVVYLGGLHPEGPGVSEHLESRAEVGDILRARLAVTELRAPIIIGSGSGSFELIRYVTERNPLMIVPRCFRNEMQPIAIRDVLRYLVLAAEREPQGVIEIGGADRLSFQEMLAVYAEVRGLRRRIVVLPLPFAPRAMARWVSWVTPVDFALASPLLAGLARPLVADTRRAEAVFPEVVPMPYRRAIELALERIEEDHVESHWSGALGAASAHELTDWEGVSRETRTLEVNAPVEHVFASFASLGGDRGWPAWSWAWRIRGLIDKLVGGPGLRRGRRHPRELLAGEAVDFWRVEAVRPPEFLRLRAEMRLPGRGWLQWEATPTGSRTRLVQTAAFAPRGLWGAAYWSLLYPLHSRIFGALIRAIAREAERTASIGAEG